MTAVELLAGRDGRQRVLEVLEAGGVAVVPTDTVYGLAARVDRPDAIERLFAIKGRPPDMALPVLVGRMRQAEALSGPWPAAASALSAQYWPGPLTIVLEARPGGPRLGGDGRTIGLRYPAHGLVRLLCRATGPLAVTSANRHGEPTGTTAGAVLDGLGAPPGAPQAAAVGPDAIFDGGSCTGRPSTVVDCSVSPPACVREGAVPWAWVLASLS
jgi:tRNA threonylcarbamoyl adenosine modification protein (Sua5/YciO/YrdC/YwlC family)